MTANTTITCLRNILFVSARILLLSKKILCHSNMESPLDFPFCCHGHTARFVIIVVVKEVMMMIMCFQKLHQSCRFLDAEGLDCGAAARDKKLLGPFVNAINQELLYLTDSQKKDREKRFDLMTKKVEEMTKSQDVHGLARIIFGGSCKQRYQNFYVLFHGGEQLFLTVTGKGKKPGMKAEWLAKVEVVEAMGQYSSDQLLMEKLAAARGYNPHTMEWASFLNWPIGGSELLKPETTRCTGQFHRPGESVKR